MSVLFQLEAPEHVIEHLETKYCIRSINVSILTEEPKTFHLVPLSYLEELLQLRKDVSSDLFKYSITLDTTPYTVMGTDYVLRFNKEEK